MPFKKNPTIQKAEKLYNDFFGRQVASEYEIDLEDMEILTDLGNVEAIEYKARKHSDKKQHIYRHSFKNPKPRMLSNGKQIIIFGKYKINERGIVG